jgi:histone deacetylase 6
LPIDFDAVSPDIAKLVHTENLVDRMTKLAFDDTESTTVISPQFKPRGPGVRYTFENDTYDNEFTSQCVFKACGGVVKAVESVCRGDVNSAFANIRPPGHHADADMPSGFCFFNNVAVAAKYAKEKLGMRRVMILDWDVHHGNGTQDIFEEDPEVMFVSMHRFDEGFFYPVIFIQHLPEKSRSSFCGKGDGKGFSFNIGWNTEDYEGITRIGDGDAKLAFDNLVMPITKDFNPDLVIVSAGFDAMAGDPLGKMSYSPAIYSYMTHQLQSLAHGKLVVALEGGYSMQNIANASEAVVKTLLGDQNPTEGVDFSRLDEFNPLPTELGRETVLQTSSVAKEYWDVLEAEG